MPLLAGPIDKYTYQTHLYITTANNNYSNNNEAGLSFAKSACLVIRIWCTECHHSRDTVIIKHKINNDINLLAAVVFILAIIVIFLGF